MLGLRVRPGRTVPLVPPAPLGPKAQPALPDLPGLRVQPDRPGLRETQGPPEQPASLARRALLDQRALPALLALKVIPD